MVTELIVVHYNLSKVEHRVDVPPELRDYREKMVGGKVKFWVLHPDGLGGYPIAPGAIIEEKISLRNLLGRGDVWIGDFDIADGIIDEWGFALLTHDPQRPGASTREDLLRDYSDRVKQLDPEMLDEIELLTPVLLDELDQHWLAEDDPPMGRGASSWIRDYLCTYRCGCGCDRIEGVYASFEFMTKA